MATGLPEDVSLAGLGTQHNVAGGRVRRTKTALPVVVILAVTLAVRLMLLFWILHADPSRVRHDDSKSYTNTALALCRTGRLAVSPAMPDVPQTVRTPGYPVFIAGVYALVGEDVRAVLVVQAVISVATIGVAWLIARALWSSGAALVAVAILCVDVVSLAYSQILLTEALFAFFLTLTVLGGVQLMLGRRASWAVLVGVCLALATLVRPITYYLMFAALIWLGFCELRARRVRRRLVVVLVSVAAPWLVLVGGWQVRNFVRTGSPAFSHIVALDLLYRYGANIVAQRDGISVEAARDKLDATVPGRRAWVMRGGNYQRANPPKAEWFRRYAKEGRRLAWQHPFLFIKIHLRGMAAVVFSPGERQLALNVGLPEPETGPGADIVRLSPGEYMSKWLGDNRARFAAFCLAGAYLAILYVAGAYALVRALQKGPAPVVTHLLIIGVVLYCLAMSGGTVGGARFRVPIMPLIAVYAAKGLTDVVGGLRARRRAVARSSDAQSPDAVE